MGSKDSFYFSHDDNAVGDPKIVKLIRAHGYEAYGLFWAIVEKLYAQDGRLPFDLPALAWDLRIDEAKLSVVVKSDLFYIRKGMIGSESVDRRLAARKARVDSARASAAARWGHTDAMRPHSERNAEAMLERKKERKKEITAADEAHPASPSAADLSQMVKTTADSKASALFMAKMEDARLPFDFGDFKRGGRINDLPAETCGLILERVPRLGLDLRRFLQIKIDEKKADSNGRKK